MAGVVALHLHGDDGAELQEHRLAARRHGDEVEVLEQLALVFFGVANAIAHMLFARAFALAPVSALAPYEYSPLLLGGVIGFLIWAEVPAWTTLAGAVVVIAAGLYNLHRERQRRAAERRDGLP